MALARLALALVLAVMFVARPVAIMFATIGAEMQLNERVLLAWIAPRGIVGLVQDMWRKGRGRG